jgi:non-specific serine/threonine protein kinase
LTNDNVRDVAQICTRLDGLPLAIELAAAQLGVLSPKVILERLQARAPFVLSGVADLPARHRTLRAAVASSYDLLDADARHVFRWCGVFAGGFTPDAAGHVLFEGERSIDLLPVLALLADKNLLQVTDEPDGAPRFRWLETIRSFAVDLLTLTGEFPIARRRHAEYYLSLAESLESALVGRDLSRTLDDLEREYDNFRAVFHWALDGDPDDLAIGLRLAGAMYRFWILRGHLGESRAWLDRALPLATDQTELVRAKALHAAGIVAGVQGDDNRADAFFTEALELWREAGDTARVAVLMGNLGLTAQNRGDVSRAAACFEESQALYEQAGDQRGIAIALGCRARLERQQGRDRQAVPMFERTVTLFRELGDDRSLANSLINLGQSALTLGDLDQSLAYFTECLELRQSLGNTLGIGEVLEGFAALAGVQGRPRRAARLYGAAEALREITGAPLIEADRVHQERYIREIQRRLGAGAFASEWAAGRATGPEEAVRLALRVGASDADAAEEPVRGRSVLTRREQEVAALVARGMTNRQVAAQLLVAPRTIETHLEHIFAKLGVQTRAEVAAWATRHELLSKWKTDVPTSV